MPTNKPMLRTDYPDVIYKSEKAKFNAAIIEIEACHQKGQPALVGTTSIEKSELLSHLLKKKGIKHSVLNAKYHEKEAEIIAQAGRFGALTIATNMAGRGTDIVLGGNPDGLARELLKDKDGYSEDDFAAAFAKAKEICEKERQQVVDAGGLFILGTERHESRRIDNQLRGRTGRQGDPGASRFYLSLEDDLMRIFGSDRISGLMDLLKMEEDIPIENKMVTKAIENSQKKVEAHNFDMRKHLLEYDDVMNKQRKEIYSFRLEALQNVSLKDKVLELIEDGIDDLLFVYCPDGVAADEWDMNGLKDALYGLFSIKLQIGEFGTVDELRSSIVAGVKEVYEQKEQEAGSDVLRYMERMLLLQVIDTQWKDHLLGIDHIKEGIGLRGYAQRDPLVEYKKEAFDLFADMSGRITSEFLMRLFKIQVRKQESEVNLQAQQRLVYNRGDAGEGPSQPVHREKKVGRNDPCPCGSGKKHKKCCGAS